MYIDAERGLAVIVVGFGAVFPLPFYETLKLLKFRQR